MVMDADGFFQLHDMFAWQPIRVSRVTTLLHPFCMVMDADGFFQLHDMFAWQPIRVCNPTNPNWLPCKHIVELEETVSIHNHAKGVPDATMTSVAFQLASGPREPLEKKKARALHCFLVFFSPLFWTGCELERN